MGVEVTSLGPTIQDRIHYIDDDVFASLGLLRGDGMARPLCEGFQLEQPDVIKMGGTVPNTAVTLAGLGHDVALMSWGEPESLQQLRQAGITLAEVAVDDPPHAHIVVTPDKERTMISCGDTVYSLDLAVARTIAIQPAELTIMDGYFLARHDIVTQHIETAHAQGTKILLSLVNARLVKTHRDFVRHLLDSGKIDWVVGNASEIEALHGMRWFNPYEGILSRSDNVRYAVTIGAEGACVFDGGVSEIIPPCPVDEVIDTVGAGDAFLAGFVSGLLRGQDTFQAAGLGNETAAQAVQRAGGGVVVA